MHIILRLWHKVRYVNFYAILLFSLCIIAFSSIVIFFIEKDTFDGRIFNAFWWTMTTVVTVGYGDISPQTTSGRAFTMLFVYPFGIGTVGLLIGKMAESYSYYQRMREEGKMNYKESNHYILIGWANKTQDTIDEILEADKKAKIVLIDELEKTPIVHPNVHFIQGDPMEEGTLLRANIFKSKAVSIFSDNKLNMSLADAKTLSIATEVENLSKENDLEIYTVVEVMKEKNIKKFKYAKADEFILSNDTVSNLMAHALIHNGSSELFRELSSKQTGENLYEIKKKEEWKTYRDAFLDLMEKEAILVWDKNKKAVNRIFDEEIPTDSKLFIICTSGVYEKIKN